MDVPRPWPVVGFSAVVWVVIPGDRQTGGPRPVARRGEPRVSAVRAGDFCCRVLDGFRQHRNFRVLGRGIRLPENAARRRHRRVPPAGFSGRLRRCQGPVGGWCGALGRGWYSPALIRSTSSARRAKRSVSRARISETTMPAGRFSAACDATPRRVAVMRSAGPGAEGAVDIAAVSSRAGGWCQEQKGNRRNWRQRPRPPRSRGVPRVDFRAEAEAVIPRSPHRMVQNSRLSDTPIASMRSRGCAFQNI